MANITTRRSEPHEALAGVLDPARALDPFRMLRDLMRGDLFAGTVPAMAEAFAPDVEIKETKDSYELTIDLPGVREQDLEVDITGNRLTVSGRREEEDRREDDRFFVYERSYGAFSRSFVLPEGADVGKVRAELRDGALHLTVPKKAEMQSRRVEIGGKEAGGKELAAGRETQRKEEAGKEGSTGQPPQKKAA